MDIDKIKYTDSYSKLRSFYKNVHQKKYLRGISKISTYADIDFNKEFKKITEGVENYISYMSSEDMLGKFAVSSDNRCIYSYVYLSMLYGLLGKKNNADLLKEVLIESQAEDGLFYDKNILNYQYVIGDGWGARHLVPQMIIAMQHLNIRPVHPFRFLDPFMDYTTMYGLMETLDWKKVWYTSNFVMNIGGSLQYARDYMNRAEAADAVHAMEDWLVAHIRKDSGMWFDGNVKSKTIKYEMLRGAYHLYPILLYDKIDIPYREKAIDIILSLQNEQGGFDFRKNSSACEDTDATDSLIWQSKGHREYRENEVEDCLKKAFFWIKQNQMADGGFVFRLGEAFDYGHPNMTSRINESNLFATWFRFLSLCHINDFMTNGKRDYGDAFGLNILYHISD